MTGVERERLLAKPLLSVSETARLLGIGRNKVYELARRGELLGVRVHRVDGRYYVPARPLARALGLVAGEAGDGRPA